MQKAHYPQGVKHTSRYKDSKDKYIIYGKNNTENDKTEKSEKYPKHLTCQERLHSRMVTYALKQIAHQLGIEKRHRQFEELYKEVADKRYIDPHRDVEQ
jgi:hypothetical protein